jgi:hypothetical protein
MIRDLVDLEYQAKREAERLRVQHLGLSHAFYEGLADGIHQCLERIARYNGWDRYQFFAALEADRREREAGKDRTHGVDRWFTRGPDAAASEGDGVAAQGLASSPAEPS